MMEKPTFFARRAILVLMIVFFLVPFAMRGARMAVLGMKNDVKDWLPRGLSETQDLDWFRKYFVSEQFVLVSWDGCTGDAADERYRMFVAKLQPETPPSEKVPDKQDATENAALPTGDALLNLPPSGDPIAGDLVASNPSASNAADDEAEFKNPTKYLSRPGNIGDKLGLYLKPDQHYNWGGRQEKWIRGLKLETPGSVEESWYYITPEGDLFQWEGVDSPLASLVRTIYGSFVESKVEGQLVHAFGPLDGPWYHDDPRRLRAQLFKTMNTGPDVLHSLTRKGGELADDPEEAHRRLSGALFGQDGKQTCIMLTLSEAAKRNLHLVMGRGVLGKPRGLLYEIADASNISEAELRMGGPAVDNVAIDEEGTVTLFRLVGMCLVLGVGLAYACFRSITATIMIFFIGGISAVLSLAFVWWMGSSTDAILMSMPALVYVLGLSGAAHIMNYYHDAVEAHGYPGAPERAIAHGWKPALMCNITTAIGLASLYMSELIPIQKFGLFSAIGVMGTLLVLFTYLPAALQIWPQKPRTKSAAARHEQSWLDRNLDGFWDRLGSFIIRHNMKVALTCIAVIAVMGWGVKYTQTSVNMLRMFHKDAKIIKDYEWLEANLGHLVPMEIVVKVPKAAQLPDDDTLAKESEQLDRQIADIEQQIAASVDLAERSRLEDKIAALRRRNDEHLYQLPFLERMELGARVQRVIEDEFGPQQRDKVGRAMSAATFVRTLPDAKGDTRTRLVRTSTSSRLQAHRDEFLHSDYLRVDEADQSELWRISLRIGATKGIDYGQFVGELKDAVEPVLAAQRERETILRQLVDLRQSTRIGGARVLLLGVPVEATLPPPPPL
jgi:hypothetical protein